MIIITIALYQIKSLYYDKLIEQFYDINLTMILSIKCATTSDQKIPKLEWYGCLPTAASSICSKMAIDCFIMLRST